MASRGQIAIYRAARAFTLMNDDEIAWMIDHRPECAADVPAEIKRRLGEVTAERPLGPAATQAPIVAYDFAALPHGGRLRLLPEAGTQGVATKTASIHHSIVGSAEGAWALFANASNLESTNIVAKSGYLWQIMSRDETADANLGANGLGISTETEDNGDPDNDPWTDEQIDTLVAIGLQDAQRFGIPRQRATSCSGHGLGFHVMWGAPSCWTPVAKTCPGLIRRRQWAEVVLPRYIEGIIDMGLTADDRQWILDRLGESERRGARWTDHGDAAVPGAGNHLANVRLDIASVRADIATVRGNLAALDGAVTNVWAAITDLRAAIDALGSVPGGGATKAEVGEVVRGIFGKASVE